jgi:hypothetical protein
MGGGRWQGTGKAAGEGGEKGKHRKGQRTELTKRNSLTEDTPRDAVTNALRLHLHNFACKTFKIKHEASWRPPRSVLTLLLISGCILA